jgi:uncharacterized membrane protein (UPF0127 family)
MVGMRYAIDLVFLDDERRTVRTIAALAPNRFSPKVSEATSVLELPVGTLQRCRIEPGTIIEMQILAP